MTDDGDSEAETPATGRRRIVAGVTVLGVGLAIAAAIGLLASRGDGSPAERHAAVEATVSLAAQVVTKPTPSSKALCAAVGPRTRGELAGLAQFLPEPRTTCRALPNRLLRAALEPLPGTAGKPLEASIDGHTAVIRVKGGPEVARAVGSGDRWDADPGVGGIGAWRLETSRRCSRALTNTRLSPLTTEAASYREAVAVRLRGVSAVLEMLQPHQLPEGIGRAVAEPRAALTELRDGLRRALEAADGRHLSRDAPDDSQLPSLLQLLEAFPSLRKLGVPCLGGPAVSDASMVSGNDVCRELRGALDQGYSRAARSETRAEMADAFDLLAQTWSGLGDRIDAIDLAASPALVPVQADAVRSGRQAGALAERVAVAARGGRDDTTSAGELDLAQQATVDGLMALGFRWCGTLG